MNALTVILKRMLKEQQANARRWAKDAETRIDQADAAGYAAGLGYALEAIERLERQAILELEAG